MSRRKLFYFASDLSCSKGNRVEHEQEHEHDYDEDGVLLASGLT
jgi:hypothetical protein